MDLIEDLPEPERPISSNFFLLLVDIVKLICMKQLEALLGLIEGHSTRCWFYQLDDVKFRLDIERTENIELVHQEKDEKTC